jgi:hypothetical protein
MKRKQPKPRITCRRDHAEAVPRAANERGSLGSRAAVRRRSEQRRSSSASADDGGGLHARSAPERRQSKTVGM